MLELDSKSYDRGLLSDSRKKAIFLDQVFRSLLDFGSKSPPAGAPSLARIRQAQLEQAAAPSLIERFLSIVTKAGWQPRGREGEREGAADSPAPYTVPDGFTRSLEDLCRKQAFLEHYLLSGMNYRDSLAKAGLPAGADDSGEEKIEYRIRSAAMLLEYLRQGIGYETARRLSGLGRDPEPGCHNIEETERRLRHEAWIKEFLRRGLPLAEASARASEKTALYI